MMKKTILFLVLVLVAPVLAGMIHKDIQTDGGSRTWLIKGTAADTSEVYDSKKEMEFSHWCADSIAADSVKIRFQLQVIGANGWMTVANDTVTADSTNDTWVIASSTAKGDKFRIIQTGLTGNCKLKNVISKLRYVGRD